MTDKATFDFAALTRAPRHPGTTALLAQFNPPAEPTPTADDIVECCAALAYSVGVFITDDSPELTAGLRKLLEARDCFIRAAVEFDHRLAKLAAEQADMAGQKSDGS